MIIIVASHNPDKIREFREIIPDPAIDFVSMGELGFHEDIVEDGHSYRENAALKARAVKAALGGRVLADDSGLQIDCLDGFPGLYSARFAGVNKSYKNKIEALHSLLRPYPQAEWTASFHCSLCFIDQDGSQRFFDREVRGRILPESRGENGFGYDPIFYLPELGKTNAELPAAEKNRRSHRGLALRDWYEDLCRRCPEMGGEK